jgi:hypothetical protein
LDDFALDLAAISQWTQKKKSWTAWSFFYKPSPHIWQGLRRLVSLSKQKKEVGRVNFNSNGIHIKIKGWIYHGW